MFMVIFAWGATATQAAGPASVASAAYRSSAPFGSREGQTRPLGHVRTAQAQELAVVQTVAGLV